MALAIVHPLVALAIPLVLSPSIHFHLLRNQNQSNAVVAVLGAVLLGLTPILFPCNYLEIDYSVKGASFFFVVRILEMATFPRSMNSKWKLADYGEFLATSSNKPVRAMEERKGKQASKDYGVARKERKWIPRIVHAKDRNLKWFVSMGLSLVGHWLCYTFTLAYFQTYGCSSESWLLNIFDIRELMDHVMFAIMFYCDFQIAYVFGTLGLVLFLGAPYTPLFDKPYLATSLRDFWSHRWNYPIKLTFHRIVFTPILHVMDPFNTSSKTKSSKRHSELQLAIATFASFLFSALFHEYTAVLLFSGEPLAVNSVFFIMHGILCILQVSIQRISGYGISWGVGPGWSVLGWIATMITLLVTCPLFLGQYARSAVMVQCPVSPQVLAFFKTIV
ncbi:hypothetical protein BDR26DRAFT_1006819 [Obelidium mucronatum]|nr:hypothetical protein BDR26DRAFT_1006819 [Obelidium mucronatum]